MMLLKYGQQFYAQKAAVYQTKVTATAKVSSKGTTISWKKATGESVDGYVVYRANKKNGSFKKVSDVKKTSTLNKDLKVGKTYYYKVRGYKNIDGHKVYTKYSNVVSAKAK